MEVITAMRFEIVDGRSIDARFNVFEQMSFSQQLQVVSLWQPDARPRSKRLVQCNLQCNLQVVQGVDVLAGVHGAGMTLSWFLR